MYIPCTIGRYTMSRRSLSLGSLLAATFVVVG